MAVKLELWILRLLVVSTFWTGMAIARADGSDRVSKQPNTHEQAQDLTKIPEGWESYLTRPDILEVSPKNFPIDRSWQILKAAQFSFVAMLLKLYPTEHLYFFARDSEHLYDIARLATLGTKDANRIHLVNLSRRNSYKRAVPGYLAENGLTEESLARGERAVIIDTGFFGTIQKNLAKIFSAKAYRNLKTHFIVSHEDQYPSARVFLSFVEQAANYFLPATMDRKIYTYETMARFTHRSSDFDFVNGRYHPISPIEISASVGDLERDGDISKTQNLERMQDIRADWETTSVKENFAHVGQRTDELLELLATGGKRKIISTIRATFRKIPPQERLFYESLVRDILEAQINLDRKFSVTAEELGFREPLDRFGAARFSVLDTLPEKFPEWAEYLKNPEDGIKDLFEKQNWSLLTEMTRANDIALNRIIIRNVYDGPATGPKRKMQLMMLTQNNYNLEQIIREVFSQPGSENMADILEMIVRLSYQSELQLLSEYVFSKPHAKHLDGLLDLLLTRMNPKSLVNAASTIFNQEQARGKPHLFEKLIPNANSYGLFWLASAPLWYQNEEDVDQLLVMIIQRADQEALGRMAKDLFPLEHANHRKAALLAFIERAVGNTLEILIKDVMGKPYAFQMIDVFQAILAKNLPPRLLAELAETLNSEDFRAYGKQGWDRKYTDSPEWHKRKTPEHEVLVESLRIADAAQRKRFIADRLRSLHAVREFTCSKLLQR